MRRPYKYGLRIPRPDVASLIRQARLLHTRLAEGLRESI